MKATPPTLLASKSRPRVAGDGRPAVFAALACVLFAAAAAAATPPSSDTPPPLASAPIPVASTIAVSESPKPTATTNDAATPPAPTAPDGPSKPNTDAVVGAPRPERDSGRSRRSDRRRDRGDSASASGGTNTTTNASANGTDFASFQIIADRNIFNANRSARSARVDRDPPPKQVRVDTLALVGSMSYTKGDFAFFDGSSSEFRRVLKAGDTVAGFQVQTIGRESVQLQSEGKTLELSIGSHLRREDGGEWRLVAESAPASSFAGGGSGRERRSDSSSSSTPGDSSTSSTSAGSGDADDILQRLMKKREQEMK